MLVLPVLLTIACAATGIAWTLVVLWLCDLAEQTRKDHR